MGSHWDAKRSNFPDSGRVGLSRPARLHRVGRKMRSMEEPTKKEERSKRQRRVKQQQGSRVIALLAISPKARDIAMRSSAILAQLRERKRKIWPLTAVAKMLGISPNLLRSWIRSGCLRSYRPPPNHRRGIKADEIRIFVEKVTDYSQYLKFSGGFRRRPARERCRSVFAQLDRSETLSPREFAERAKVATTTVRRLASLQVINAHRPTPHRIRICRSNWKDSSKKI